MRELDEPILSDDYPVYYDYLYIVDGKLYTSTSQCTVGQLKVRLNAKEIRRCDIVGRVKEGQIIKKR